MVAYRVTIKDIEYTILDKYTTIEQLKSIYITERTLFQMAIKVIDLKTGTILKDRFNDFKNKK